MNHEIDVKQTHEMEKSIRGETVTVTPTLARVPSDRKEDATVTFVTNLTVSDATKEARGCTRRVMRRYARRWGIENKLQVGQRFPYMDDLTEHRRPRVLLWVCCDSVRYVAAVAQKSSHGMR